MLTTVLGELLFPRVPPPAPNGAFGRGDWVANGLPFTVTTCTWGCRTLLDTFTLATTALPKRLIGIGTRAQSVFFATHSSDVPKDAV